VFLTARDIALDRDTRERIRGERDPRRWVIARCSPAMDPRSSSSPAAGLGQP
jgi:hypothetical protein